MRKENPTTGIPRRFWSVAWWCECFQVESFSLKLPPMAAENTSIEWLYLFSRVESNRVLPRAWKNRLFLEWVEKIKERFGRINLKPFVAALPRKDFPNASPSEIFGRMILSNRQNAIKAASAKNPPNLHPVYLAWFGWEPTKVEWRPFHIWILTICFLVMRIPIACHSMTREEVVEPQDFIEWNVPIP